MTLHILSCHCGSVKLHLRLSDPIGAGILCDCSLCRRRGAVMATVAINDLKVLQGAENLTLYQFNTETAQHYFCKTCGVYTHHRRRSNPNEYGINTGALEDTTPADWRNAELTDGVNHPSDK